MPTDALFREARSAGPSGHVRRGEALVLGVMGPLLFAFSWEGAVAMGWLNPRDVSSPRRILAALAPAWQSGELGRDLSTTLLALACGLVVATVSGLLLGALMATHRDIDAALNPFVWFLYSAPMVAFYPLLMLWFGLGLPTVTALIVLLAAVPIAVNTRLGLREADRSLIRAARSLGAGWVSTLTKVSLPAALPLILAGLRVATSRALIAVVLGEMFSANAGLGYRLAYYGARLRTTELLVQVALLVVIGVLLTQVIRFAEMRTSSWRGT